MRASVKLIVVGIDVVYGGLVTKIAHDQQEQINTLEKKLKKSKKESQEV